MNNPNLFQFSSDISDIPDLKLKTKPRSLEYGRRLYQFSMNGQMFWLKAQQRFIHAEMEQSYLNELSFYQQAQLKRLNAVLPFQVLQSSCYPQFSGQGFYGSLLVVPHADPLFDCSPAYMSIQQIGQRMLQAIEVLEELHLHGFLHADLKQEHFRIFGVKARLIDFEQVVRLDHPATGQVIATPRYMAPELFHAEPKSIRSEIYALGVIFLEWLLQQRLEAKTYREWAVLHCQQLKVELPEKFMAFSVLLNGMLAKKKELRMGAFTQLKACLMFENV